MSVFSTGQALIKMNKLQGSIQLIIFRFSSLFTQDLFFHIGAAW